jgi:peptidoglycan/LPS O-acetylase OafA/YrhL
VKQDETRSNSPVPPALEPILRPHMPELDTIRGLAILGVLLYHGFYWARDLSFYSGWHRTFLMLMSPGQFGVNLFFVLSGFLITGILLHSRPRQDYFRRFYLRRALRILPPYYLTLLLLVVFKMTSLGFLAVSLAFSSNMAALFGLTISYGVLWSLAVEEHFYLFWPSIVRRISDTGLFWLLGALLLLSPLSRLYYFRLVLREPADAGYASFTWNHLDGLALGAIFAILVRRPGWGRQQVWKLAVGLMLLGVLLTAIGYPFGILTRTTQAGIALQYVPWNLASAGLLGLFLWIGTGPWKAIVAPRPLTFLGKISYGLYLYHVLVFQGFQWIAVRIHFNERLRLSLWEQIWARMLLAGSAAILAAYVSRRYFEEPFLKFKDGAPRRRAGKVLNSLNGEKTTTDERHH